MTVEPPCGDRRVVVAEESRKPGHSPPKALGCPGASGRRESQRTREEGRFTAVIISSWREGRETIHEEQKQVCICQIAIACLIVGNSCCPKSSRE